MTLSWRNKRYNVGKNCFLAERRLHMKEGRSGVLSGWKDIANYLGQAVRTVQRYECELGLPVHRPSGKLCGSVIAVKSDLDAWVAARPARDFPVLLDSTPTPLPCSINLRRSWESSSACAKKPPRPARHWQSHAKYSQNPWQVPFLPPR